MSEEPAVYGRDLICPGPQYGSRLPLKEALRSDLAYVRSRSDLPPGKRLRILLALFFADSVRRPFVEWKGRRARSRSRHPDSPTS